MLMDIQQIKSRLNVDTLRKLDKDGKTYLLADFDDERESAILKTQLARESECKVILVTSGLDTVQYYVLEDEEGIINV